MYQIHIVLYIPNIALMGVSMDKREVANLMVKRALSEALFALLAEKSLSEITVSALIEKAGVARASFYRNFESLESVLHYSLDRIIEQYIEECPSELVDYSDVDYLTWKFSFYQRYADKLLALKGAGLGDLILSATNQLTLHRFNKGRTFGQKIERYFSAGAFSNVTLHWLESGAQESPEEMARIFAGLYSNGATMPPLVQPAD